MLVNIIMPSHNTIRCKENESQYKMKYNLQMKWITRHLDKQAKTTCSFMPKHKLPSFPRYLQ